MTPVTSTAPRKTSTTAASSKILSRTAAAILGGYLLAAAVAALLAAVLPMRKADAATAGMQLSFVVYVAAAIWAFSPVPVSRVWAATLGGASVLGVFAWLLR